MNPIGMPKYDGGERFDLRLPYVDEGYVEEDTETFFFGMFTRKKKKDESSEGSEGEEGSGKK